MDKVERLTVQRRHCRTRSAATCDTIFAPCVLKECFEIVYNQGLRCMATGYLKVSRRNQKAVTQGWKRLPAKANVALSLTSRKAYAASCKIVGFQTEKSRLLSLVNSSHLVSARGLNCSDESDLSETQDNAIMTYVSRAMTFLVIIKQPLY